MHSTCITHTFLVQQQVVFVCWMPHLQLLISSTCLMLGMTCDHRMASKKITRTNSSSHMVQPFAGFTRASMSFSERSYKTT